MNSDPPRSARAAPSPGQRTVGVPPSVTVREMMGATQGLSLRVLAGAAGLDRVIDAPRIQKSGLALAGHFHGITPSRIQILGQTEQSYLGGLPEDAAREALIGFFALGLCCVVLTGEPDEARRWSIDALIAEADRTRTPLLLADRRSSATITSLHGYLDDRLSPRTRLHGVLVDVFGVGLLLRGASGIGKSECALDLVMSGHRLVADDVVECDYRPPGMVFGAAPDLLKNHIEVRGLGILDVKDLFGVTATRARKRIDVVVKLVEWNDATEYDRLGLDEHTYEILGVTVRELVIPVRPGRDMASIVEVAARSELLKHAGHHAAREFFDTIDGAILSERSLTESAVPPPVRSRR